ncbi:hypothetical protein ACJMK2_021732 [Sinanodonta woodiana]|uniref:B30.2/SPRY domain-containing protein n=1 Tax=Sinanodonta woodiana TaxID=1069815 RepID=A0ABD3THW9_SINWO
MATSSWRLVSKEHVLLFFLAFLSHFPGIKYGILNVLSDDGDKKTEVAVAVSIVSGLWYVILIIVFVVCAGIFSLCGFLICWCKQRRDRKNGIFPRNTPAVPVPTPLWVQTIQSDRNMEVQGFNACSDGIIITSHNSVMRFRQGNYEADGARWSIGLEHGKHVFEVVWPDTSRGTYATIGVGSLCTPLHTKPKTSLIGMTEASVGLDIVRKRIIYNGEPKKTYPPIFHVPEKFLMYVDCDSGKLSFGTDECFWGIAFENIDRQMYPLHIMASLTEPNANLQIFYKGSAVDSPYMTGPSTICAPGDYSLPMEILEPPTYEQASGTNANIQPLRVPDSPPPPYKKVHEKY